MNEHQEGKPESDKWKIVFILFGLVFIGLLIFAYFQFFAKGSEEEEALGGKSVVLDEKTKAELEKKTIEIMNRAGNFGFKKDFFLGEDDFLNLRNSLYLYEGDELYKYYTTREKALKDMVNEGLISGNGKANLNTNRWDEKSEVNSTPIYTIENIEIVEMPSKAVYSEKDGGVFAEVKVKYDSVVFRYKHPLTAAPEPGEEIPDYLETSSLLFKDKNITLIFKEDKYSDWKLYDFRAKEEPKELVFWHKPNGEAEIISNLDLPWVEMKNQQITVVSDY